ncbi:exodeoxyribonuclease VII small subunit [Pectobacteriaceae bacterium C80]|nr:exodeoxyribonuclease VII small subunit [Pectobacteriaceae bacterium C80]
MASSQPDAYKQESETNYAEKTEQPVSFESSLSELEQIVTRLESGELPLEDALNEFEHGIQLARQGQQKLQQAEQRVQILLNDDPEAALTSFTPDNETL